MYKYMVYVNYKDQHGEEFETFLRFMGNTAQEALDKTMKWKEKENVTIIHYYLEKV